jgi:hypothetical protein
MNESYERCENATNPRDNPADFDGAWDVEIVDYH